MERQNQEPQEGVRRRKELYRVIQKIRNTLFERHKDQPGPSKLIQIEEKSKASKKPKDFEI